MFILILVAVAMSNVATAEAAMCNCTFLNGHKECMNLSGSECARVDQSLTNATCEWSAAGFCASKNQFVRAKAKKAGPRLLTIRMYYQWDTYRQDLAWAYFTGGPSVGDACPNGTQTYQIHLANVTSRSTKWINCPTGFGAAYGVITYTAP